jgi:hypothetical protein
LLLLSEKSSFALRNDFPFSGFDYVMLFLWMLHIII